MFNFFQKSDNKIQQDVVNELRWDPSITPEHISVAVTDGIVTLRGSVPHYFEKMRSGDAAQRVGGVRGVADEITVDLLGTYERRDEDIARAALTALEWNYQVPESVKVFVENGWITLKGEVAWDYQRTAAKRAVSQLMGVRGVSSEISIKPRVQQEDVKKCIEEALKRSAENEARDINVMIKGDQVTLTGKVESFAEMDVVTSAAWNAPGVKMVENLLKLSH